MPVSGAKNSALKLMAATLLAPGKTTLQNVPDISDVHVMGKVLKGMGATIDVLDEHTLEIDTSQVDSWEAPYELVAKMRASTAVMGPLLGRFHRAKIAMPGGCNLGPRPIDQHLKAFTAFGAEDSVEYGQIHVKAEHLTGAHVFFDTVSVGATMNAMLAAVLAEGTTILENVAREPHIVDLANFLNMMGADVHGAGTDVIKVHGVKQMHGCNYSIIPDQIEAGTFMFATAVTGGNVVLQNVIPKHLEATTAKLEEIGCEVEEFDDAVRVRAPKRLHRTHVKTLPYPGYPTDMQPQIAVTLALAEGTSIVTESIFENRFRYVDELARMGASIKVEGNVAVISGVEKFTGARVSAPDLRAGAALVIAGLAAEGITIVDDIYYIER